MNWQNKLAVLMTAATIIATDGDGAFAQNLFGGNGYNNYQAQYYFEMTLARIAMMVISAGTGFAIGWFLSPQAKELRRIILIGLGCLALAVAVLGLGVV